MMLIEITFLKIVKRGDRILDENTNKESSKKSTPVPSAPEGRGFGGDQKQ